jgi:hypothetical protein
VNHITVALFSKNSTMVVVELQVLLFAAAREAAAKAEVTLLVPVSITPADLMKLLFKAEPTCVHPLEAVPSWLTDRSNLPPFDRGCAPRVWSIARMGAPLSGYG